MTSKTFTQGTVIDSAWLNDVNTGVYTTLPTKAAKGANTDITSLSSITSINGGGLAGYRNRVINGSGQIAQRPSATLSSSFQFGPADRIAIAAVGATSVSGTLTCSDTSVDGPVFADSGRAYGVYGAAWTNGKITFRHRFESANVRDLNSKTITVSCKIYHTLGSQRTFKMVLASPTVKDDFTTVTDLTPFGTSVVDTSTSTTITGTYTLGYDDATRGLELRIYDNSNVTGSGMSAYMSDLQLEIGAVATPFELRPYGVELSLCQRYTLAFYGLSYFPAFSTSTTAALVPVQFPVTMRAAPTSVTVFNSGTMGNFAYNNASGNYNPTAINFSIAGTSQALISLTGMTGIASSNLPGYVSCVSASNGFYFSAEL